MKSVREMFKDLGYTPHRDYDSEILYFKKDVEPEINISFNLSNKTVAIYGVSDYFCDFEPYYMSMLELQVINKMIEELGWNE